MGSEVSWPSPAGGLQQWSILIGHGITLTLGLFLMLALASFTKIRRGSGKAICKRIKS